MRVTAKVWEDISLWGFWIAAFGVGISLLMSLSNDGLIGVNGFTPVSENIFRGSLLLAVVAALLKGCLESNRQRSKRTD